MLKQSSGGIRDIVKRRSFLDSDISRFTFHDRRTPSF